MQHLKIFIELTRLNKPIGFMLLFWPCSWGLAYAHYFDQNLSVFICYLFLFFFGSVLMRSAGCVFNDMHWATCGLLNDSQRRNPLKITLKDP